MCASRRREGNTTLPGYSENYTVLSGTWGAFSAPAITTAQAFGGPFPLVCARKRVYVMVVYPIVRKEPYCRVFFPLACAHAMVCRPYC